MPAEGRLLTLHEQALAAITQRDRAYTGRGVERWPSKQGVRRTLAVKQFWRARVGSFDGSLKCLVIGLHEA
jgi:predicted GTPase